MAEHTCQLFPYHADLIQELAKQIVDNHQEQLPFLHNVIVLVPNYQTTFRLQEYIAKYAAKLGHETIIGLQIFTLKDYIQTTTLSQQQSIQPIARELLLLKALNNNHSLFGQTNALTTSQALLELFDELTQFHITIPTSLQDFQQQLQQAYQCTKNEMTALSNEAQIIHTLWRAWHTELNELNLVDPHADYQLKLLKSLQNNREKYFYLAGYYDLLPTEIDWLTETIKQNNTSILFQGEYRKLRHHPATVIQQLIDDLQLSPIIKGVDSEKTLFLNAAFDNESLPFKQRAEQISKTLAQSPIDKDFSFFRAGSFEEEATAIANQVRNWLALNITNIALLIEDRRLARRTRAILEHAGIGLIDLAGWALSTSSAASLIENWLQCIEENFYYIPFIDVLKSPFALNTEERYSQAIYRFEQDIIHHENILRDLTRYRQAIKWRENRLNIYHSKTTEQIREMFQIIEAASAPLFNIFKQQNAELSDYLDALIESLNTLSILQKLEHDDAGKEILALLEKLQLATQTAPLKLTWIEFRHWFGLKLEEHTFVPENRFAHHVDLLHLSQTVLNQYQAIIIGNMTQEHYPGGSKSSPFFNQSVRAELGLPTLSKQSIIRFYHFRRALESTQKLLLTYNQGEDETPACSWLILISRFHQLCFNSTLENEYLSQIIEAVNKQVSFIPDQQYLLHQAPRIEQELIPQKISASSHQQLINCPYAFFAGTVLKLRAPDEIREKLSKSEYGSRIHLCLQAFHIGDVKNIPGPFKEALNVDNRDSAIQLLKDISLKIFHNDLEDNFQHRGWLKRWTALIPDYINWQIERSKHWQFYAGEIDTATSISNNLILKGRIDRVDINVKSFALMDYKTGTIPSKSDVEYGEAVQLPHYALTYDKAVQQIEYLQFEAGSKTIAEKCTLSNEELITVTDNTTQRIKELFSEIAKGDELPAWGNEAICGYCQYSGMCRKYLR